MANTVPASLGKPVTTRQFSWGDMARRAWGSEYSAPDHRVYVFSNGRGFDSTDRGTTGIYRRGQTTLIYDSNGNALQDSGGNFLGSVP